MALLRAIPGAEVTELDAGCCGMAGSFGFEAEHYDLSMQIGELRLFPAVRAEPAGTSSPRPASPAASRSRTAPAAPPATRWRSSRRSALLPPA